MFRISRIFNRKDRPMNETSETASAQQEHDPKPPTTSWDHAKPEQRQERLRAAMLVLAEHSSTDVRAAVQQMLD